MRFWGVVAAAAAVLMLLPAGAGASPYVRYGVQDDAWIRFGPGTLEQRLDRLESLGVELVRLNVQWNDVEARPGVYDWSRYDPAIKGMHERGIETMLTLYSTPAWANGGRGTNWAPLSGAPFASFARVTALRYPWVKRWMIWNEPNQRRWLQPTSPEVYVEKLLNPAYAAIHKARPGAIVAGGATAPRAATGGISPVAWIDGMAVAGAKLDAYAHNPYPLNKAETPFTGGCDHCDTITLSTVERLITRVTRAFGAGKRVWLTEFGFQTNPPDSYLGVSRARQSLYIGEAALRAYLAPRVDMLIQFLIQDEPELDRWQSGVLTARGQMKPSYLALRMPLAQRSRTGRTTTLWGQVRPGTGAQRYRLEQFRNGVWKTVSGTKSTTATGYFTRVVLAGAGAEFRVVQSTTGNMSPILVVT
jgi:Cellulase (glycosyl hydrolase family 5)